MITLSRLKTLAAIPAPVLSVYWTLPRFGKGADTPPPEEWTHLKAAAKELLDSLSTDERKACDEQLSRLFARLNDASRPPTSMAIFVSHNTWEAVELPVPLELQVHWGAPDLHQLMMLVGENKPYGIAVVDHSGAWLFRFQAGELNDLEVLPFGLNTSNWKRMDLGHVTAPKGIRKTRGSQRDAFQHRVDAHFERFCGVVAERLRHFHEAEHFAGLFLLGSPRVTRRISADLPPALLPRIVRIENERGHASLNDLRSRVIAPKIASWQEEADTALVSSLLLDGKDVVVGLFEILPLLQRGAVHRVVLAPDFDAPVQQCLNCGWVNVSADPYCPICRGARSATRLHRVLPQLILAHNTEFTIPTGPAAKSLLEMGGIAALRESVGETTELHEVSAA